MAREAISDKIIVVGIDGMDPCLTRKYMARGVMPNVEKLMQHGSYREDLVLMGAQPTITPPCWTTLSTGAYPATHGITCFKKQGNDIADLVYGMGSDSCKAEQLWDCFVEAGKKTLVCQWPGASWPPTKDDENLILIDGIQPTFINMLPIIDSEEIILADVKTDEITFKPMAATDGNVPCVVKDLEEVEVGEAFKNGGHLTHTILILNPEDGEHALSAAPYNIAFSPIKDAKGWANAPEDAKEFVALFNYGFIRRTCLILKNEAGVYDHIAIYKNKKAIEPKVLATNFPWPLLMMIGVGVTLGSAVVVEGTGVSEWIGGLLGPALASMGETTFYIILAAAGVILTNLLNNNAMAIMMSSIVASLYLQGVVADPILAILIVIVSTTFGFVTPASSFYGAMIHGNEFVEAKSVYKYGILMAVFSWLLTIVLFIPITKFFF